MKYQIMLPAVGKPIEETVVNSPVIPKKREIEIYLPRGYEHFKYKVCFISEDNGTLIGPFINGEIVDFGQLKGKKIKVKAILDKEYKIGFKDVVTLVINTYAQYCPLEITYRYTGVVDIDAYNLAMSTCTFSNETLLLERAKNIMETVLRAIISRIVIQNQASNGGVSAQLFYKLGADVELVISQTFHEACNQNLIWCKPVGCLKIENSNMNQVIEMLNIPIEIERKRTEQKFLSDLKLNEICTNSIYDIKKENIRSIAQIGATGVVPFHELSMLL